METIFGSVQQFLTAHAYSGIFALLFLGAFGPSLPEEIVLVLAGFLVYSGAADPMALAVVALVGVVLSDTIIYAIGYRYGMRVLEHRWITRIIPAERTLRMRDWLGRYRYRLIFFGRYLYGLRPAVFLAAGLIRMKPSRFIGWDVFSTAFSIALWGGLGYAFGGQIDTLMHWIERSQQGFLVLLGVVGALALITWMIDRAPSSRRWFRVRLSPQRMCALLTALLLLCGAAVPLAVA